MNNVERFFHLEKSLKENSGSKIHGFRSGGGLRVLRLEDNQKNLMAYAEAPNFDTAIIYLMEDLAASGRKYEDVYGKIYPHYLTGTTEISSNIDHWLLSGRSFDIQYLYQRSFYFKSEFSHSIEYREVADRVTESRKDEVFETDGIIYHCSPINFANGEPGCSCKVIENHSGLDPWFRKMEISYENESLAGLLGEVEQKLLYWINK